jgi:hypothetical protein
VLVKSAWGVNAGALAGNLTLFVVRTGQWGAPFQQWYLEVNGRNQWNGWFVLHPGDAMYLHSEQPDVYAWVSGAVLGGAPPFPIATRELPSPLPRDPGSPPSPGPLA